MKICSIDFGDKAYCIPALKISNAKKIITLCKKYNIGHNLISSYSWNTYSSSTYYVFNHYTHAPMFLGVHNSDNFNRQSFIKLTFKELKKLLINKSSNYLY